MFEKGNMGKIAFIAGLVIAVLFGLGTPGPLLAYILTFLGLVVGFMNITAAETKGFILAAIGLMVSASSVHELPLLGDAAGRIIGNLITFMAPAVLVVALKTLFETAKD